MYFLTGPGGAQGLHGLGPILLGKILESPKTAPNKKALAKDRKDKEPKDKKHNLVTKRLIMMV